MSHHRGNDLASNNSEPPKTHTKSAQSPPDSSTLPSDTRNKLVEILGLEVAPDGQPDFLLTRDEYGTVLEGVSYAAEVDQIADLLAEAYQRGLRDGGLE